MDIATQIAQITGTTSDMLEESRKEHQQFESLASELNAAFSRVDTELTSITSEFSDVLRQAEEEEERDATEAAVTPTT